MWRSIGVKNAHGSVQDFPHFRSSLELRKIVGLRLFCFCPHGGQKQSRSGDGPEDGCAAAAAGAGSREAAGPRATTACRRSVPGESASAGRTRFCQVPSQELNGLSGYKSREPVGLQQPSKISLEGEASGKRNLARIHHVRRQSSEARTSIFADRGALRQRRSRCDRTNPIADCARKEV
jgi:hypothetical protein